MIVCLQIADASFLLLSVLALLWIMGRDYHNAPYSIRATILLFCFFAFAQAMWLLGVWVPSAAGFPLPRVALDGSIFLGTVARLLHPLEARYLGRRHMRAAHR